MTNKSTLIFTDRSLEIVLMALLVLSGAVLSTFWIMCMVPEIGLYDIVNYLLYDSFQ
ncbi:hypothetical protein [Swingsia samuiensis]|uniref:hypothetical protein n=1 Tax=Swingsia samuiensis TaxID=1293412 RepID=UPI0015E8C88D|nr:hypothetical protein [Swingsia samuiensis]